MEEVSQEDSREEGRRRGGRMRGARDNVEDDGDDDDVIGRTASLDLSDDYKEVKGRAVSHEK